VLGIEKNSEIGMIGSSSYGDMRMWRIPHTDKLHLSYMKEVLLDWATLEEESGKKLIYKTGCLYFGPKDSKALQAFASCSKGEIFDAKGIMAKFPAMKVPEDYCGVYDEESGLKKAREILHVFEDMARKNGAEFLFSTEVAKIEGTEVHLTNGKVIEAKQIAISCGKETLNFTKEHKPEVWEVEYLTIADNKGLPS